MQTTLTNDLENFICPEAIKLFTPQELSSLKEWFSLFREANLTKTCETMLCIPPKSKELEAAIKRVSSRIIKGDMRKLSFGTCHKKSPRETIWSDFKLKLFRL